MPACKSDAENSPFFEPAPMEIEGLKKFKASVRQKLQGLATLGIAGRNVGKDCLDTVNEIS
eukprot:4068809-Pyramimonas_sp.AAC.1